MVIINQHSLLVWGFVLAVLAGCNHGVGDGTAAKFPSKNVSIICPWAPGGGTDMISRFWADALQREYGTPFVVVNRTGGSGAVGHSAGALARPDGHTITMITAELSTMHWMGISQITHDSFATVLQVNADAAAIIVRNDAPWKSLGEMLADAKMNHGKLKMSGTATGGTWDLARAGLLHAAGLSVDSIIWVPTKGAAPSLVELLGGHIDAVCCSVPEAATQIEAGQLRALAVMSEKRLSEFPDIPTAREAGVDWVAVGWRGLAVPKGTPPLVVDDLLQKCRIISQSEAFQDFMKKNGYAIEIRESSDFTSFLAQQDAQWKPVVEAAGYAKQ